MIKSPGRAPGGGAFPAGLPQIMFFLPPRFSRFSRLGFSLKYRSITWMDSHETKISLGWISVVEVCGEWHTREPLCDLIHNHFCLFFYLMPLLVKQMLSNDPEKLLFIVLEIIEKAQASNTVSLWLSLTWLSLLPDVGQWFNDLQSGTRSNSEKMRSKRSESRIKISDCPWCWLPSW